jgi:hypothetical protein
VKTLRSILSLLFALLVFMSSTSFMVGIHHCGGEIREVAVLEKADGCGHQELPPCHRKLMQNCCKDDVVKYDGQGFEQLVKVDLSSATTGMIVDLPPVLISIVVPEEQAAPVNFHDYPIPIRSVDLTITHHEFLI